MDTLPLSASRSSACLLGTLLLLGAAACSSSSNGGTPDAGGLFGPEDSGSSSGHKGSTKKGGSGTSSSGASSPEEKKDAACGTVALTPDWCMKNAPMETAASNVYCEDFDTAEPLSGDYGYSNAIAKSNWVGGAYVSPYCALKAPAADGTGAYSFHAYTYAYPAGALSMAADLYVPNQAACNGATVIRVWASPNDTPTNAAMAWLKVSDFQGSGATPTSYTVELYVVGGTRPDGGAGGGSPGGPTKLTVTPDSTGWARVGIDATAYSIPQPAMGGTAQVQMTAVALSGLAGVVKAAHMSTPLMADGLVVYGADTPGAEADVGVIPDPATGVAATGCQVLVDDAVSNLTE